MARLTRARFYAQSWITRHCVYARVRARLVMKIGEKGNSAAECGDASVMKSGRRDAIPRA